MREHLSTADVEFWLPINNEGKRRLRQLMRYFDAHWPTPFPVELRVERIAHKHAALAETYRDGKRLIIRIDYRASYSWSRELLVHEWAHAVTWPASVYFEEKQYRIKHPDHPPEWRAIYGEILSHLYDDDGLTLSEAW